MASTPWWEWGTDTSSSANTYGGYGGPNAYDLGGGFDTGPSTYSSNSYGPNPYDAGGGFGTGYTPQPQYYDQQQYYDPYASGAFNYDNYSTGAWGSPSSSMSQEAGLPAPQVGGGVGTFTSRGNVGGLKVDVSPVSTGGVTGNYGVESDYTLGRAKQPALLSQSLGNQGNGSFVDTAKQFGQQVQGGLDRMQDYTNRNPSAVRLGLDAAGLALGYYNQRQANKLAQQELDMRREAQQKNAAMADQWNAQAQQSANEARSLYNPQEMAIRAMASQKAATQRGVEDLRTQMAKTGASKATIDAEVRRQKLAGSTGAVGAFTKGLDTGRAAQQAALTGAKGLSSSYNAGADYKAAELASKAGQDTTAQYTNMLNTYLGNPVYAAEEAARRRAQAGAQ